MINIIKTLFQGLWYIFKIPLFVLFGCICLFYILVGINLLIARFHGRKLKKGKFRPLKKHSIFHRLFIELPKRFTDDMLEKDPDYFVPHGLVIFEGRQGSGKTSSMIKYVMDLQAMYPLLKCSTNLAYKHEDMEIKDWRDLINFTNGIYGVVVVLDELQNWFSSNMSRNFPPQMLELITQNRKNRRIMLGTSQNFYLLAKPIRSQCTEVRQCLTLLGCLTIVRRRQPIVDSDGEVKEWKNRGWYFYVHSKELRDSYDTYKVIKSLTESGFQENTNVENNTVINIMDPQKKKKKLFGK